MTMTIHVDIVSAEAQIFSGLAEAIFAPAHRRRSGCFATSHAPFLSPLKPGEVRVLIAPGQEESFFISGGVIEVQPHLVTVLADTALRAKDIDEAAALEAKQRAEKMLSDQKADIDYSRASAELAEAMAQLQALDRLRKIKQAR
jgi:F-type H+-transporting ATPase subunit epsilon